MADGKRRNIANGAAADKSDILSHNNLRGNPFRRTDPPESLLDQVFVGRENEMVDAVMRLTDWSRNLLIVGEYGYGKTTFLKMLLRELAGAQKMRFLPGYGQLAGDSPAHFQISALTAFANGAKRVAAPESPLHDFAIELERELAQIAPTSEPPPRPDVRFRRGLELAQAAGIDRVVIAIDEVEKRDASVILALLMGSRFFLDLDASFVLTGRFLDPFADPRSSLLAAFDHRIELHPFTSEESLEILRRNLATARIDPTDGLTPFTDDAALAIVEQSRGLPRPLNLIASETMQQAITEAIASNTRKLVITPDHMKRALQREGNLIFNDITAESRRLLTEIFHRQGYVSGADLDDLDPGGALSVVRQLDRLIAKDIVVKLQASGGPVFALSPPIESSIAEREKQRIEQRRLWDEAGTATDKAARGRALESFAATLFEETFHVRERNLRTDTEEFDLVIEGTPTTDPAFRNGNLIIVECKNWTHPVGQNVVSELIGKLYSRRFSQGFILARERFTSEAEQQARYTAPGIEIILIDGAALTTFLATLDPLNELISTLRRKLLLRAR